MSIQHKDITGTNIHEPKGADTALAGFVYVSNGSGSGSWTSIGSKAIKGLPSTNPISNQVITTDGDGGFQLGSVPLYGSFTTGSPSAYTIGTSYDRPPFAISPGQLSGMTVNGAGLRASIDGVYKITAGFAGTFNRTNSDASSRTITFRLRKNGASLLNYDQETTGSLISAYRGTFRIDTYLTLNANDYIEIVAQSTIPVTCSSSSFSYASQLLR